MFGGLIAGLNGDKWEEIDTASKSSEFASYNINRNHTKVDSTTYSMLVATDDGDAKTVFLKDTEANTDPLKSVSHCELLIKENDIIGIDLDDDVVVRKDN